MNEEIPGDTHVYNYLQDGELRQLELGETNPSTVREEVDSNTENAPIRRSYFSLIEVRPSDKHVYAQSDRNMVGERENENSYDLCVDDDTLYWRHEIHLPPDVEVQSFCNKTYLTNN